MVTRVRKTNTEQKILETATGLFHRHGLRGVGVDQVIAESGVAKSTLYAHFRTKDDLVAAYLRHTDESWMGQLKSAANAAGTAADSANPADPADPADRIVGLFDALLASFDRHGFFGCPFISAAVEAEPGSKAHAATVAHVQRRQAWLAELAREAGAADPRALADHLGLLIDGALASGRLLQDRAVVDAAKAAARDAVSASTS